MKTRIYYDNYGRIVSIVEMKEDDASPPAGIFPLPDCKNYEIELTDDQAKLPLIALHIGYRLDLSQRQPRLVPLAPDRDKTRKIESPSKK